MFVGKLHPNYIGVGVLPTSQMIHNKMTKFALNNLYYIKRIGIYQCSEKYKVDRISPQARLNIYHVFFILSGKLYVSYEGQLFTAPENSVVMLDCRKEHCYYSLAPMNFIWLDIDGSATEAYFELLSKRPAPLFFPQNFKEITRRIQIFADEIDRQAANEHDCSCFVHELFSQLTTLAKYETVSVRRKQPLQVHRKQPILVH